MEEDSAGVDEENIRLGGKIELSGFHNLDGGEMIVIKKIVGNYVRKIEERCKNFNGLKLTLKTLHEANASFGGAKKFELHGQLVDGGQVYPAQLVERNLFVGIDAMMRKLEHEIKA